MSAIKEHYHDEIENGQREAAGDLPKHKWRSAKRFQYMIISKCIHCGCLRQKIDLHRIKYLYDPFGIKTTVEPKCKVKF